MKNLKFVAIVSVLVVLGSCASSRNAPIRTVNDQINQFHQVIENVSTTKHIGKSYQSVSYGEMTVFKPMSFIQLDSMYRIKQSYIDKGDYRGLRRSGIEEEIPAFRAAAQEELHEVKYEIQHLYHTTEDDSLHVYHDFFVFDYKDSLISVTTLYDFKFPKEHRELFYAYQFGFHFVDDRDLHISKAEQDFIHFFRIGEFERIGEEDISDYMSHVMDLMRLSRRATSVDFRELSRWQVVEYFTKNANEEMIIEDLGTLFVEEVENQVVGYDLEVVWRKNELGKKYTTKFNFSPYLKLLSVVDSEE